MKKVIIFILLIGFSVGCSKKNDSDNAKNSNSSNAVSSPLKTPAKEKMPVPKVSDFRVEYLFRFSKNKDDKNNDLPPYEYGEISSFSKSPKVKVGEMVTAVLINADHENLTLTIKKVEKTRFLDCDAEKTGSRYYFENITDRNLLDIKAVSTQFDQPEDRSLDFLVIYPAVKTAKKLKLSELTKEMLPENTKVEEVIVAVDLNDDEKPDLLVNSYCCYFSGQCDCTNNYQKINDKWKIVAMSEPC